MKKEMLQFASVFVGCVVMLFAMSGQARAESNSVLIAEATAPAVAAPPAAPVESEAAKEAMNADSESDEEESEPEEPKFKYGGWIETGTWGNEYGNDSTVENGDPLGSNIYNEGWHVQQLWLYTAREADNGGSGFDWGFRLDAMFGTEAGILQSYAGGGFIDGDWSTSGDGYGFALPQAYLEMAMNRWTFKFGKFETIMGYEDIQAPDKLFYSHTYAYNHEPATHSGGLAEFAWNENVNFLFGVTTGADGSFHNEFGDVGLLGGVELQLTEKLNFSYAMMWNSVHAGDEREEYPGSWDSIIGAELASHEDGREMLHSFVLEWNITERLTYAWQFNYGWAKFAVDGADFDKLYEQIAIVNYLTYQWTERMTLGARFEWFRQNDMGVSAHQNCYAFSGAAKYQLCKNLHVVGELRYDEICGSGDYEGYSMFGADGAEKGQFSYGCSFVAEF